MKRLGLVRASYDLLEQAMRLPEGMTIVQVFNDDQLYASVLVKVTGPMCPEVREGEMIPHMVPDREGWV